MTTLPNSVYLNREFNCSVQTLFKWLVDPELMCQWFGPKQLTVVDIQSDLCVGGKFNIQLAKPDNTSFYIEGQFLEIKENHNLKFSFAYKGLPNTPPDSIVDITIEEIEDKVSKLTLIQKFAVIPEDMKNRTKAWEYMLQKLEDLVTQS